MEDLGQRSYPRPRNSWRCDPQLARLVGGTPGSPSRAVCAIYKRRSLQTETLICAASDLLSTAATIQVRRYSKTRVETRSDQVQFWGTSIIVLARKAARSITALSSS